MSDDEKIIELHASQAGSWMTCSKRAEHEQTHTLSGDPEETHVGTLVGNRVGHEITGHEYDPPIRITFDEVTRTPREMDRQVEEMIDAAKNGLMEAGWRIEETEYSMEKAAKCRGGTVVVRGTADLIVRDKRDQRWVIDLKTGKRKPVAVFLQAALYSWLFREERPDDRLDGGGVMWVPRTKLAAARIRPVVKTQPLDEMFRVANEIIRYMAHTAVCGTAPSPSIIGCAKCPMNQDCPASAAGW